MATVGRQVRLRVMVMWDLTAWTDESARLISATGSRSVAAPGSSILSSRGAVPHMQLRLANGDNRFSSSNASSPIYAYIAAGNSYHTPVSFQVSVDGGSTYERVFYGLLKTARETAATHGAPATVTFDCRGREERIAQQRISTTLSDFSAGIDSPRTEADVIEDWLDEAGLGSGDWDIDAGMQTTPFAWLDEESPLEDIWALSSAAGGWFFSDRDGVLTYRNATALSVAASVSETLSRDDYGSVAMWYDDKELYSEVVVEASPRIVARPSVIWTPDDVPFVPANSSIEITAQLRQPAYVVSSIVFDAVTSGGLDINNDISVTQTQFAQRIDLEITNANTVYGAQLRNMQIVGRAVDGAPTLERKQISEDSFWSAAHFRERRSRRVRGNVYVQSSTHANQIAAMLRDWHETPRRYVQVVDAIGDPTRELLDRVSVVDADLIAAGLDVLITGIRWTADGTGFRQTLEGIAAAGFYPYADTTPGYFILGTSKMGSGTGAGRLFY